MSEGTTPFVGRATEQAALQRALGGSTRLIVVTGAAGSGKTALIRHVVRTRAGATLLMGTGKHADGDPGLGPLLSALRDLVAATLERLFEPAAGRRLLEARLGPLAWMLEADREVARTGQTGAKASKTGPGRRTPGGNASNRATLEQVAFLAQEVVNWASGLGLPCLVWIDDWDRASPDVGAIYRRLIEQSGPSGQTGPAGLCLVGSGRTWPGFLPATPDHSAVIHLGALADEDRLELLRVLIGRDEADYWQQVLGQEVSTPLAVISHLTALRRSDQGEATLPGNASVMAHIVAAVGDALPLGQLETALGRVVQPNDPDLVWLTEAGIVQVADGQVLMRHDTVRDAVLEQPRDHQHWGSLVQAATRLLEETDPDASWAGARLALVALSDRTDSSLLQASAPALAADTISGLARAARQGVARLEATRAHAAAQLALKLSGGILQAPIPVLMAAAVTAVAAADLALAEAVTAQLRATVTSRSDISDAYRLSAITARQALDRDAALALVREGLGRLGVKVPAQGGPLTTLPELVSLLWRVPLAEQAARQQQTVERGLIDLLALAGTIAFEARPELVVHIAAASVTTRGSRGTGAAASSMVFLSGLLGRFAEAARWGEIAIARLHPDEPEQGGVLYRSHFFGRMWRHPAASFDTIHDELHMLLLAEGNIPLASWSLRNAAMLHWRSGRSLQATARAAERGRRFAREVGDELNAVACQQILDCVDWLADPAARSQSSGRPASLERPGTLGLESHTMTWIACHTYAGDPEAAMRELATTARPLPVSLLVHPGNPEFRFHRAVNMLQATGKAWPEDLKALALAARLNPTDHAARHAILQALVAQRQGRTAVAAQLIQRAMTLASAHNRAHDRGLAARLAASIAPTLRHDTEAIAREAQQDWGGGPQTAGTGQAQSDLALRLDQAEQELRAKGRLLAMVGHELRTPLQAAAGAAELMGGGKSEGDEKTILETALGRLGRIVDDLSDIAVAEGSALAVQPQPFQPVTLLRSLITTHAPGLHAAGRHLAASLTGGGDWHFADARRLGQIADNLLVNAARHGAGDVLLELSITSDRLQLAVEDDGAGIDTAAAATLFEPFVRGPGSTGRAGHGLGLWLARKLAVAMGGELVLAPPAQRRGARFELDIPCPPCPAPRQTPAPRAPHALSILLVEDEPLGRTVLSRLLKAAGHQVLEAEDRASARTWIDSAPPDAALIDLNLPDGSGIDVARDLRERWPGAPVKVVIATAQLDSEATGQISGLVDAWVAKPVSAALLGDLFGRIVDAPPAMIAPGELQEATVLSGYAETLWHSVEAADVTGTAQAAHRLIGAAGAVGRPQLADSCRSISARAQAGDWPGARTLAREVMEQLRQETG